MIDEQLEYYRDLRALKQESTGFRRYINGFRRKREHLMEVLSTTDPSDSIEVARLQAVIKDTKAILDEYETCENTVLALEKKARPVIKKIHEEGNVPPS